MGMDVSEPSLEKNSTLPGMVWAQVLHNKQKWQEAYKMLMKIKGNTHLEITYL